MTVDCPKIKLRGGLQKCYEFEESNLDFRPAIGISSGEGTVGIELDNYTPATGETIGGGISVGVGSNGSFGITPYFRKGNFRISPIITMSGAVYLDIGTQYLGVNPIGPGMRVGWWTIDMNGIHPPSAAAIMVFSVMIALQSLIAGSSFEEMLESLARQLMEGLNTFVGLTKLYYILKYLLSETGDDGKTIETVSQFMEITKEAIDIAGKNGNPARAMLKLRDVIKANSNPYIKARLMDLFDFIVTMQGSPGKISRIESRITTAARHMYRFQRDHDRWLKNSAEGPVPKTEDINRYLADALYLALKLEFEVEVVETDEKVTYKIKRSASFMPESPEVAVEVLESINSFFHSLVYPTSGIRAHFERLIYNAEKEAKDTVISHKYNNDLIKVFARREFAVLYLKDMANSMRRFNRRRNYVRWLTFKRADGEEERSKLLDRIKGLNPPSPYEFENAVSTAAEPKLIPLDLLPLYSVIGRAQHTYEISQRKKPLRKKEARSSLIEAFFGYHLLETLSPRFATRPFTDEGRQFRAIRERVVKTLKAAANDMTEELYDIIEGAEDSQKAFDKKAATIKNKIDGMKKELSGIGDNELKNALEQIKQKIYEAKLGSDIDKLAVQLDDLMAKKRLSLERRFMNKLVFLRNDIKAAAVAKRGCEKISIARDTILDVMKEDKWDLKGLERHIKNMKKLKGYFALTPYRMH